MNSATLQQFYTIKQEAQEGKFSMHGVAFTRLLHNLIREYGQYKNYSYKVDVNNFSLYDKRLILSHFESAEWYAHACESITNTEALFDEYKIHVQKLIDDECDEVYRDDMEEMRNYA
jgi:hypothetical protein